MWGPWRRALSVDQLIDDQPEFGTAFLQAWLPTLCSLAQACLPSAHLTGRGRSEDWRRQVAKQLGLEDRPIQVE